VPRRKIDFVVGEYYHVYNRGNNRAEIFFDRDCYLFFLERFTEHVNSSFAAVVAYCLLPNHYHFLLQLKSTEFSDAMQAFGTSYTKAVNKRFDRVGPLFQGRFQAIHVDRDEYLVHLSRYIHLNPVVAQLVKQPLHWEMSSYAEYMGCREGLFVVRDSILKHFDTADAYRRFVEVDTSDAAISIEHLMLD